MLRMIAFSVAIILALPATAQEQASPQVPVLIHAGGSTYKFTAEIADTGPEREQGLMFREHLDPNQGMLFLYPVAKPVAFWMKNTPLSLDLLFIAADGRILNVAAMAKPFDTSPISSQGPAIAVFEILGGSAAQLGIEAGDKVEWPAQSTPATP
jgi:hypothetical protein